jgi:hypothetical protein
LADVVVCSIIKVVLRFHLITSIPQWWAAGLADFWRSRLYAYVIENFTDLCTIVDDRDEAHLATAVQAQQWKYFINACDQFRHRVRAGERLVLAWVSWSSSTGGATGGIIGMGAKTPK